MLLNEELAAYVTLSDDPQIRPPTVDWAGLKAINDDVVGWIQIPGTVINYPVYQGEDNDYYLNTNAHGVYGIGGQIFMDYENQAPGMLESTDHHLRTSP